MTVRHLHFRDFVPPHQHVHVAESVRISGSRLETEHDHDFHEVFFVEGGRGVHTINGERRPLVSGLLAFIRDRDVHGLAADGGELRIVNIAFAKRSWTAAMKRYFDDTDDVMRLPHADRVRPMSGDDHAQLRRVVTRMQLAGRTQATLDHFLIEAMWAWLRSAKSTDDHSPPPDWLTEAVRDIADPEVLQGGTPAFADRAGRSADHVARAARQYLGKSPTELINEARMDHAARALAGSDRSILDIAIDVGLPNLAHFYKLFAARHGCTPRKYRLQQFRIIGHAAPTR